VFQLVFIGIAQLLQEEYVFLQFLPLNLEKGPLILFQGSPLLYNHLLSQFAFLAQRLELFLFLNSAFADGEYRLFKLLVCSLVYVLKSAFNPYKSSFTTRT